MAYFTDGGVFSGFSGVPSRRQALLAKLREMGFSPEELDKLAPTKGQRRRAQNEIKKRQRKAKQETYRAAMKESRAVGPSRGMYREELRNWRAGNVHGLDDQYGIYALSGLDDSRGIYSPMSGLGDVPPGTSDAKKKRTRKTSYYYLYLMASLAPKFRQILGVGVGVSVAGLLTGPLAPLIALGAGGFGVAAAGGVENTALETTLWWMKGGNKDARAYLKGALIQSDTRDMLLKAVDKLADATAKGKNSAERVANRARRYFLDFIAVGPQSGLRSLNAAQQAAFGAAYLDALGSGSKENLCLAAGTSASNRARNKGGKSAAFLAAKQAKEQAAARRQAALDAARASAKALADKRAALDAARARLRAAVTSAAATKAQQEVVAAEVDANKAATTAQQAEQVVTVVAAEEKKAEEAVKQAEAEVVAEAQPTPEEKAAATEQDSEADKAEETATAAKETAEGTATTPPVPGETAPPAKGGGGLLPVVGAVAALALGAPALPVVGAAAALAFLTRKK